MAEIVNLNRFRKAREREEERRHAAENRTRHGRGKTERSAQSSERGKAQKELDGKRLDRDS